MTTPHPLPRPSLHRIGLVASLASLVVCCGASAFAADEEYSDSGEANASGSGWGGPSEGMNFQDLRLGYTVLLASSDITITSPGLDSKKTGSWDATGRTGFTWITTPSYWEDISATFLFGAELSTNHLIQDATADLGTKIDVRANVLTVQVGLGWQLMDQVHLEATPFIGYGLASTKTDFGNGSSGYLEFGLRVGGFYTFENRIQVGLNLGYFMAQTKVSISDYDLDLKASGLTYGLQGGYRF
jgi:hypothetical protein